MSAPLSPRTVGPFSVKAIGLGCMNLSHAYLPRPAPEQAERLKAWARRQQDITRLGSDVPPPPQASEPGPLLFVDDRRPGRIVVAGRDVVLQDKQYQLIRLLSRTPGECVPYETIYQELWGSVVVEDNQMHFQKRKLIARIREGAPGHEEMVKTVAKQGFILDLTVEQVETHLRNEGTKLAEASRAQALLV